MSRDLEMRRIRAPDWRPPTRSSRIVRVPSFELRRVDPVAPVVRVVLVERQRRARAGDLRRVAAPMDRVDGAQPLHELRIVVDEPRPSKDVPLERKLMKDLHRTLPACSRECGALTD